MFGFRKPDRKTVNGVPVEQLEKEQKKEAKKEARNEKDQEKAKKEKEREQARENRKHERKDREQSRKDRDKARREKKEKDAQKAKEENMKKEKEDKTKKEKEDKEKKEKEDKAKKEKATEKGEEPKTVGWTPFWSWATPSAPVSAKELKKVPKQKAAEMPASKKSTRSIKTPPQVPAPPRTTMEPYKKSIFSREVPACCFCVGLESAMVAIGFLNLVCGGLLAIFALVLKMLWWNYITGGVMAASGLCAFVAVCGRNRIASWMTVGLVLIASALSVAGFVIAIMWMSECLKYCKNNDCDMGSYCWGWGLTHIFFYVVMIVMQLHYAQVANTWRKRRTGRNRSERRWTVPEDP